MEKMDLTKIIVMNHEPLKKDFVLETIKPMYSGLTLINEKPYAGKTSIKYWM